MAIPLVVETSEPVTSDEVSPPPVIQNGQKYACLQSWRTESTSIDTAVLPGEPLAVLLSMLSIRFQTSAALQWKQRIISIHLFVRKQMPPTYKTQTHHSLLCADSALFRAFSVSRSRSPRRGRSLTPRRDSRSPVRKDSRSPVRKGSRSRSPVRKGSPESVRKDSRSPSRGRR